MQVIGRTMIAAIISCMLLSKAVQSADQVDYSSRIYDVKLNLTSVGTNIVVTFRNSPYESVTIPFPIVQWQPGTGGAEMLLWDIDGNRISQCVSSDYGIGVVAAHEVAPGETLTKNFELSDIIQGFCAEKKTKFFLQVNFHFEVMGKIFAREVLSNPILIEQ